MMRMLLLLPLLACGGESSDDTDDPASEDCSACGDDEFCLVMAEGDDFDDWTESCEPVPEACDLPATCDCASELYDLCPDSPVSWACSDTMPPAIVTCGYD